MTAFLILGGFLHPELRAIGIEGLKALGNESINDALLDSIEGEISYATMVSDEGNPAAGAWAVGELCAPSSVVHLHLHMRGCSPTACLTTMSSVALRT